MFLRGPLFAVDIIFPSHFGIPQARASKENLMRQAKKLTHTKYFCPVRGPLQLSISTKLPCSSKSSARRFFKLFSLPSPMHIRVLVREYKISTSRVATDTKKFSLLRFVSFMSVFFARTSLNAMLFCHRWR